MKLRYNLYLDDSGSRDLDKHLDAQDGSKWFALGGILIAEEDEPAAREAHRAFCESWNITYPLHSYDIRSRTENFQWLKSETEERQTQFLDELSAFLLALPVLGVACVIDRLGYSNRYRERYGRQRWKLCKTTFCIVTERAAKFAHHNGRTLYVRFERSDLPNENKIMEYYEEIRRDGMPFNAETSAKYAPLTGEEMRATLAGCEKKYKSSPMIQLADLYLFPLCLGGYMPDNRALVAMRETGRLLESALPAGAVNGGTKYSCFEYR